MKESRQKNMDVKSREVEKRGSSKTRKSKKKKKNYRGECIPSLVLNSSLASF